MEHALIEYFRCAAGLTPFETNGTLTPAEGYFTFGNGAVCYGRCGGYPIFPRVTGRLADVSGMVSHDGPAIRLPFDVTEVASNLRLERYRRTPARPLESVMAVGPARALYYFLRPSLPVGFRRHLQRIRLRGWRGIAFPRWPVDFTVETLMERALALVLRLGDVETVPFVWFWPDGAQSAVIVTHDVETRRGLDFCDALMDIDETAGFTASFQVIPEGRYPWPEGLLNGMRRRGFEVNVHDLNHDGSLFRNKREFLRRASAINAYGRRFGSRGFRAGAMYRNQEWFDALEFDYDMSVPNVGHLEPQRGGCCTVMPYFVGRLVELPLTTIQDYSLLHILGDYSTRLWKQQIASIVERNGLVTVLTHPDYLVEPKAIAVYQELLTHLDRLRAEGRLWLALPGDVERWWRQRQAMRLVSDGTKWRVEGAGAERARIAWASLDEGRLVYTLDGQTLPRPHLTSRN